MWSTCRSHSDISRPSHSRHCSPQHLASFACESSFAAMGRLHAKKLRRLIASSNSFAHAFNPILLENVWSPTQTFSFNEGCEREGFDNGMSSHPNRPFAVVLVGSLPHFLHQCTQLWAVAHLLKSACPALLSEYRRKWPLDRDKNHPTI